MKPTAVRRGLLPIIHPVIPYDHRDSQPVILENVRTAFGLCRTMQLEVSPCFNRFIVSPEREGKDFSWFRKTLEPLNRNETINFGEHRSQSSSNVEIFVPVAVLWPDFDDSGNHRSWSLGQAQCV